MRYLLGITVGPVQGYIEESRKLLDLCNSSRIISNIMVEVRKYIKEKSPNSELIYPNYSDIEKINGEISDCSNYMVFEVEELINIKDIEEQVYQKVAGETFKCPKGVFHMFWAFEKLEDNYKEAYKNLSRLMNSLKNTYEFYEEPQKSGQKCSICGKRNIEVIKEDDLRKKYKMGDKENLCKACLFKRDYEKESIESLYSISIKRWKKVNEGQLKEITKEIEEIVKDLKTFEDKDKYYSINELDNLIINEENKKLDTKKIKNVKAKLSALYDGREKDKLSKPSYEYAFIQFDIDNLGKWMSGKYIEDIGDLRKCTSDKDKEGINDFRDYQKKLSSLLINFGQTLRGSLGDLCKVIYSGGDDFLAVLPNEDIIKVIEEIDNLFVEKVQKKIEEEKIENKITYSMSITIASCKTPMSYVIGKSRVELEKVKNRFEDEGKNGIAINYIINDGKEISCYLKKENMKSYINLVKSFNEAKDSISFSYVNAFEEEFKAFNYIGITYDELRNLYQILRYELSRLMLRSKVKGNKEVEVENSNVDKYISEFLEFFSDFINENYKPSKPNEITVDYKNIVSLMKCNEKLSKINFVFQGGEGNGVN